MNSTQSPDERPLYNSQSNEVHYVKGHNYAPEDFADRGEQTPFNGICVVDESSSGNSEEFENFTELSKSDWEVNTSSAARLSDGTILYEGHR